MTRRNDVRNFTQSDKKSQPRSRSFLVRLSSCLGGVSLLGSTIAQAQAPIASSVAIPNGATVEQALSAVAPAASPEAVAAAVTPGEVVVVPGNASTRAADLQPERILQAESVGAQAADQPAILEVPDVATAVAPPPSAADAYTAPTEVIVSDRVSTPPPKASAQRPSATPPARPLQGG